MGGKALLGLAIAACALAFGATTVGAHTTSLSTTIRTTEFSANGSVRWQGFVESPVPACLRARGVILSAAENNGTPALRRDDDLTRVDATLSAFDGRFAVSGGYPAGTDYFLLRVMRKDVGRPGHDHLCRPARDTRPV